jgi:hypothetical protein
VEERYVRGMRSGGWPRNAAIGLSTSSSSGNRRADFIELSVVRGLYVARVSNEDVKEFHAKGVRRSGAGGGGPTRVRWLESGFQSPPAPAGDSTGPSARTLRAARLNLKLSPRTAWARRRTENGQSLPRAGHVLIEQDGFPSGSVNIRNAGRRWIRRRRVLVRASAFGRSLNLARRRVRQASAGSIPAGVESEVFFSSIPWKIRSCRSFWRMTMFLAENFSNARKPSFS